MRFQAILFDLDGTLVETIHLYGQAYIAAFQARGIAITPRQFEESYHGGASIEETFRQLGGADTKVTGIREHRDREYIDLLQRESEYLPGADELFAVTENIPRAIVTGSWQMYIDAIDRKLGISKHFPVVIAADHMKPFSKPHPHGFLLAADRLGIDPKDCLVVGDQLFDIEAAAAAGMTSCLIWSDYTPKHAAGKADLEARTLQEVIAHLS